MPVWNIIPLPDNIPPDVAAMMEPFAVALHAIKMGSISKGMRVGIIGTGMIGIAAGQWAKMFGASPVTVIGRSEEKRKMVEKCGLKYEVCNDLSNVNEYDFVLEAVGTPKAIELANMCHKTRGSLVLMGNPSGDITISQAVYWKILRKQLKISGTWNSSYDGTNPSDWTEVVDALASKAIEADSLISHRFSQDNLMQGLELMRETTKSLIVRYDNLE